LTTLTRLATFEISAPLPGSPPYLIDEPNQMASHPGSKETLLNDCCDGVVMLTWSNWRTEPRSNRYHYATRFARTLPVLFVQPDGAGSSCSFEETEIPGVTIVHLPPVNGNRLSPRRQAEKLAVVLASRGIHRPILWIYNPFLGEIVRCCDAPLKVYHATEDYFESERLDGSTVLREQLIRVLAHCDLVVAVSEGVAESYRNHARFRGPIQVAPNGCDYEYFAALRQATGLPPRDTRIALFQGGINWRVDFTLLSELSSLLPDWELHVCGQEGFDRGDGQCRRRWRAFKKRPNVHSLGYLNPDQTARAMLSSTVGLIPFVQERAIVERSLPLKAFEYVACGLPVVTIPIRQLMPFPELFAAAESARDFASQVVRLGPSRWDDAALRIRAEQAARRSYETIFCDVCARLVETFEARAASSDGIHAPPAEHWDTREPALMAESAQTSGWMDWVRRVVRPPARMVRRLFRRTG
jgi:glycosyltransferase involved in cell wall biosynthesis